MKKVKFLSLLLAIAIFSNCQNSQKTLENELSLRFVAMPNLPDTLHFFLPEAPAGTLVSDTLLKACLDSSEFENLHFDTGEARFWAVGKLPLTPDLDGFLLQTEEFWFGKQSLLLFDKIEGKFLTTLEVANFYGGDGGQEAVESWLFRKAQPLLVFQKTAQHSLVLRNGDDEPAENLSEDGRLLRLDGAVFKAVANADSVVFMRKLRMRREW